MKVLTDNYTITAGDIAAGALSGCIGRVYLHQRRTFLNIGDPDNGVPTPWPVYADRPLRTLQVLILHASGLAKAGVRITVWSILDPGHPQTTSVLLVDKWQSPSRLVSWQGRQPMGAGFEWRVYTGGLVAGDIGQMQVGYE